MRPVLLSPFGTVEIDLVNEIGTVTWLAHQADPDDVYLHAAMERDYETASEMKKVVRVGV